MADFTLSRRARVEADPARVHDLIDDFRAWTQWSPWEGVDPDLQRTYSGPERGVGARYEWSGNAKAGEGSMEITESDAAHVCVDLRFLKPFRSESVSRFDLAHRAEGTDVVWTMTGTRNLVMSLVGRLFVDRAIGRDFERGLGRLKATAES